MARDPKLPHRLAVTEEARRRLGRTPADVRDLVLVFELTVSPGPMLAVASSTLDVGRRVATKLEAGTKGVSNAIRGCPNILIGVTFAVMGPDGS
jgi:hypothetical protein